MDTEGQKTATNPSAMLAGLLTRRAKLHDELRSIEKQQTMESSLVSHLMKITKHKLNGSNYYDWNRTIRHYLLSTEMDDHINQDPPKGDAKKAWVHDDARLYIQIKNSIESDIVSLVNHCNTVKELLEFLEFLYSRKEQRIYEVCRSYFHAEQKEQSLMAYYVQHKKNAAELNALMAFDTDLKVQQTQREKIGVISFLNGLPPEFAMVRSQILSGSEIPTLDDVYRRMLHIESHSLNLSKSLPKNALVSKDYSRSPRDGSTNAPRPNSLRRQNSNGDNQRLKLRREMICYHCRKPGHVKRDCWKLQYQNQRSQVAQVALNDVHESLVNASADEFAKLWVSHKPSQSSSSNLLDTNRVEPGFKNHCHLTSSSKWVIDFDATTHMIGSFEEEDYW